MTGIPALLSHLQSSRAVGQVRARVTARGWRQMPPGPDGTVWDPGSGPVICVPADDDDAAAVMHAIDKIATVASMSAVAVAGEMAAAEATR
jgi:hypothetical protein